MAGSPLDYLGVGDATTATAGKVKLATTAETTTGTNATKACTPAGVAAVAIAGAADASEGTKGIAQLSTSGQATTGTNDLTIMTPLKVASKFASPGAIGGTSPASGAFTALSADGTGAVSLVSNAAALFDATGAGIDLTLSSDAGRVIIQGDEAAANAVTIASSAGGIDADAALQINIATSQNAATAMVFTASAGGIDMTAAGGAAEDIDIVCTSGSVNISGGENVANAVVISAGAGGIDITATGAAGEDIDIANTGGSVNISSTEDDAGAILIHANAGTSERILLHSDQGTGVDSVELLSDVGGISLIATGLASEDAINLSAPAGGVDIDGALSVVIASSENAADALQLRASAGGIDILASGAAAGEDIDVIATGSSVNITSTEAVAAAINLTASTGAGGITLTPGTGDVTIAGQIKEVNSEFAYSTGTDLQVQQSPVMTTAANTAGVATGATGDVNLMQLQDGCLMEQFILGAGQTIIGPRMNATAGLSIGLDLTDNEGAEYNFGARANAKHVYTIGTDAAFFLEAQLYAADLSGLEPLWLGFRKVEANNSTWDSYTDFYGIGMNNATSATNISLTSQLNTGGVTLQDGGTAWTGGDGGTVTLKILVSASGVVTATIDGGAPSSALAYTFDNTDTIMPCIHFLHDTTTPGVIGLKSLKIGYQA